MGDGSRLAAGLLAGVLAVLLSLVAFGAFALGSCHDAGGFCSGQFGGTHVAFYAVGTLLTAVAAAAATAPFTTRSGALRAALVAGALVGVLAAVVIELAP